MTASGARRTIAGLAVVLALAAAACTSKTTTGGGDGGGTETQGAVAVTLKDFAIALDASSAPAGPVEFAITNEGPSIHEFVVFQTDLGATALPVESGVVDEAGGGLTLVDEVEDIAAGASGTLSVDLQAGSYVVICNIAGHYQQGMTASFTVA